MTPQEEFWKGEFGDDYTKRNRVDWRARIPFWEGIIHYTGARSVLEFGCNAGWNLSAIQRAFPHTGLRGVEINYNALHQASSAGLIVYDNIYGESELVFTAGVLIHIPPEQLRDTMQKLIDASCDYVLAVEYAADEETEVEYRGHKERLWKRPYGKLYEQMGLIYVWRGKAEGFDNCDFWLMRKP
jgi:pseudaminic acid biosynthesis-associated methylase